MEELKKLRINQIVKTISETHKFDKEQLLAINTSDVDNGVLQKVPYQNTCDLKGQFKKTIKKDDILFSEIRPANRRFARVEIEDTKDFVVSTKLMVLRKFNEEVDLDYFYFCLTDPNFLDILQRRAENRIGSFPQITFDLLSEYSFPIPSLATQKRISSVLSNIDRLISTKRNENSTLEAMAKEIYDYWFVQFDFPNNDGKPYKSSGGKMVFNEILKREIPEGWEVKSVNDLFEVKDGTHDSPKYVEDGYYLITSKHLTKSNIDFPSAYKITLEDYTNINKRSLVETNDILYSMIGTIGNKYVERSSNINYAIKNMALFKTSQRPNLVNYFDLYLESSDYFKYLNNGISGSIQKFVSLNVLRGIPVLFNDYCINLFNKQCDCYFKKISINNQQILQLTSLRDYLLPLLMNGQVEVKEAEKKFQEIFQKMPMAAEEEAEFGR